MRSCDTEKYYHWAIVLKENGDEPIGDIAVVQMNEEVSSVHIGYCIGEKWWHQDNFAFAMELAFDAVVNI